MGHLKPQGYKAPKSLGTSVLQHPPPITEREMSGNKTNFVTKKQKIYRVLLFIDRAVE